MNHFQEYESFKLLLALDEKLMIFKTDWVHLFENISFPLFLSVFSFTFFVKD